MTIAKIRPVFALVAVAISVGCANLAHNNDVPLNQSQQYYDYVQPSFTEYLDVTEAWNRVAFSVVQLTGA